MKQNWRKRAGAKSAVLMTGAFAVVIVLLLNVVATALTKRYPLDIDLTSGQVFALDASTRDYIAALDTPVTIQVLATQERFVNTTDYNAQADAIFGQFDKHADNITVRYIDYVKDPTFAARYPKLSMKQGDILVSSPTRDKLVKTEELFHYTQNERGQLIIASSKAEEAVLGAILNVTSDSLPKVGIITGHNESDTAAFQNVLLQNNFAVEKVQLATQEIPADTAILLLAAPKNDLTPNELSRLDAFLENGGQFGKTLFYCADADQAALPNIETFLAQWGVQVDFGAVFETDANRVYNYHPFYAVADYVNRAYADLLRSDSVPLLMPVSKPLTVLFPNQGSYATELLLQFGETSGVRPANAGEDFTADAASRRGPIPALVKCDYIKRSAQDANQIQGRSTVLVSGSAAMLQGYAVGSTAFSNAEYLVNLFNELCSRQGVVTVTPKTMAGSPLNLTNQAADRLGILFVVAVPAFTLITGLTVWLMRRHK